MKFPRLKFLDRWRSPQLIPAKDPAFLASTGPIQDAVLLPRHEEQGPALAPGEEEYDVFEGKELKNGNDVADALLRGSPEKIERRRRPKADPESPPQDAAPAPEAPIVEPSSPPSADADMQDGAPAQEPAAQEPAAPAANPITQEDFDRMKGNLNGGVATGEKSIVYPPPRGIFARLRDRLIDALPWQDSPPEVVAIAEAMEKENKSFAVIDESVLQPANVEAAPAPDGDASSASVEAEKSTEPGAMSRGLGVIAGALSAMKARASSAAPSTEGRPAPDGVVGRALARDAESPAEAPGAQEPTLKIDGFAGRVARLDTLREPAAAPEAAAEQAGPPEGVEPPVLRDVIEEADLAQISAGGDSASVNETLVQESAAPGWRERLSGGIAAGWRSLTRRASAEGNAAPATAAAAAAEPSITPVRDAKIQKIIDDAAAEATAEPLYPTRGTPLKNYFAEKAGRAKDFIVAQVKQTESLTRTFVKSAAFTAGVHVGVKMVFNNSVRALDLGGVGTALGTGAWSAGSEFRRDFKAACEAQQDKSRWLVARSLFNKEHRYGLQYAKRFGAGFGGGLLGALTFDLVTDVDDVADKVKDFGGWLRDHMPGVSSDVPVAPPEAGPENVAPAAGVEEAAPQSAVQPEPQQPIQAPQAPADEVVQLADVVVTPETSPEQLMEMLSQRDDLSEKAKEILAAAQRGEAWALDSMGVGIINAGTGIASVDYGFPSAEALGLTDAQADQAGAQLIKQSAEEGFEQGMRNNAFHQYNGIRGIGQNVEEALKTAGEHGPWKGAENLMSTTAAFCDASQAGPISCTDTGVPFEQGNLVTVKTADGVLHGFRLPEGAGEMSQAEQDEVIRRALMQLRDAAQAVPATALAR